MKLKKTTVMKVMIWLIAFVGIFVNVTNAGACYWAFYQPEVPQKPQN